jgi:hypothetical protein
MAKGSGLWLGVCYFRSGLMPVTTIKLPPTEGAGLPTSEGLLPDTPVRLAGIYGCENCGYEVVARRYECLPREQSCTDHGSAETTGLPGKVTWKLVAAVRSRPRDDASSN